MFPHFSRETGTEINDGDDASRDEVRVEGPILQAHKMQQKDHDDEVEN